MMRKLFVLGALVPCVAMLVGCPKKKDDASDAGDDGAAAAAAAPAATAAATPAAATAAAPAAKNVNDVGRFPAEKPLTDDDQKTADVLVLAKTGCKSGAQVGTLKLGTDPFKIAEFQDCILVTFPDSKDATTTLMGWIPKNAFTKDAVVDAGILDASAKKDASLDATVVDAAPVADASVGPLKCPAGQEAIKNLTPALTCRKKCTADKDCKTPSPKACANATNVAGRVVQVCASEVP